MAKLVGDAIVSDSGEWYHDGYKWRPLVAMPVGKAPGYISPEGKQLLGLNHQRRRLVGVTGRPSAKAGEELAALVMQHGSLEAVERAQAEPARPANYGLRSEDGRWWWDGAQWHPVPPA